MEQRYTISTDNSKLDVNAIHDYLSNRSYWAKGRSLEDVKTTLRNSLCFGLYNEQGDMLGFARVISDRVVFAYLMDVFVLEEHRGKGLGKRLMQYILDFPELRVDRWLLATVYSHDFYKQLGFTKLQHPERLMGKIVDGCF